MLSLTPDTEVTLLLCSRLGQRSEDSGKPLTAIQFSALTQWLQGRSLNPRDLLHAAGRMQLDELDLKEVSHAGLKTLLDRGTNLGVLVERWTSHGLWIIGRSDPEYPERYLRNLQRHAPPILFGVGEVALLQNGGLAVVGSRNANDDELEFAGRLGTAAARQAICVISGVAKGVDARAMEAAMNVGGLAVGVLAEGLGRAAVAHEYHDALLDGRLTLISPFEPESRWFPYTAMERNKLIYGLADAAVVVSSGDETGGTWTGAIEALKSKNVPVYVRDGAEVPEGNRRLIQAGARAFPDNAWDDLGTLFERPAAVAPLFEQPAQPPATGSEDPLPVRVHVEHHATSVEGVNPDPFTHVARIIPSVLKEPQNEQAFAQALSIVPAQAKAWLKRAVKEKLARRMTKPVRYVAAARPTLLFKQE